MTYSEILAEARRLVKANSTSYTTADLTISANAALNRVTALIRDSEGRWQWDDSNYTDFPIATAALVADQQDYGLDPTHYRIERIEVMDTASTWTKLKPIDKKDIVDLPITDYLSGSGVPQYYDKVGNSVFLYPKPSYSQAASLKVFYERGPDYFIVSDTTKSAGFNPLFHRLIPLWAAYDYALINGLKVADRLRLEISAMEDQLSEYYALRDSDEHVGLRVTARSFK